MQRVILHPPTLSSYLSPSALSGARAAQHRPRRHRVRQPIVSTAIVIYRLNDLRFRLHRRQRRRRYRTVPEHPEVSERFISVRLLVYPRWRQRGTSYAVLPFTVSSGLSVFSSHFVSCKLRAVLIELSLPKLCYQDNSFKKPWYEFISH